MATKVLVLGAGGAIAQHVIEFLKTIEILTDCLQETQVASENRRPMPKSSRAMLG